MRPKDVYWFGYYGRDFARFSPRADHFPIPSSMVDMYAGLVEGYQVCCDEPLKIVSLDHLLDYNVQDPSIIDHKHFVHDYNNWKLYT